MEEQEALATEKLKSLTVETQHGAQAAGATSAAAMSQPIISSSVNPDLGKFAPTPCLLLSGGGLRYYKHNCRLWSLTIPAVMRVIRFLNQLLASIIELIMQLLSL